MLEILQKLHVGWFSAAVTILFILAILLISIFRDKEWFPVSTPLAILLATLAVFVLYVISAFLEMFSKYPFATSVEKWGQVGDFFGGMLNPALAFASFMALLYTIRIQSKQLDVSTKELEATRIELMASVKAQKDSSDALEGQLLVLRTQRFYDAFSSMLLDIERFSFGDDSRDTYAYSISNETTKKLGRANHEEALGALIDLIRIIKDKHRVHKNLDEICADTFLFVENADVSELDKSRCFRRLQILLPEETIYFLALTFNVIMEKESTDGYISQVISIIKKRKLFRAGRINTNFSSIFLEFKDIPAFMINIEVLGYNAIDLGVVGLETV